MKKNLSRGLLAAVCASALMSPAAAVAAPVTVDLRVEGKTETLYEGPVTTDARTINAPASSEPTAPADYPCNYKDNGANGGFGPTGGTPITALYDAARSQGLTFQATWYRDSKDFFVNQVGPDRETFAPSFDFWGFAVNYTTSSTGGCQTILGAGNEVIWAYDFFDKAHLLKLTGPATATVGEPATYAVTDGRTGEPMSGTTVGGGTTDAQGRVTLTFTEPGSRRLKAERADSVRSNAVVVAVQAKGQAPSQQAGTATSGTSVSAPARDLIAPIARLKSPRQGVTYRARYAPRVLRGEIEEAGSGILAVKLRLTRRLGKRCWSYSATKERFVRTRCGRGFFFTVTKQASFDFLLPRRLRRGSYVLDANAIDRAYNRDDARRKGGNRVEFRVR